MGHKDKEFISPAGYTQKGSEWKVSYTHFANPITKHAILVFDYFSGLTAYEAWRLCAGYWPAELGNQGICPAFYECVCEQLTVFPYPMIKFESKKSVRESGIEPLIPVLEVEKHITMVSNTSINGKSKYPEA